LNAVKYDTKKLFTIIYTSGSTGSPKGVMLTHANLVSQLEAIKKLFFLDSEKDKALSFLPLAHVFERMVMYYYLSQGIDVYFNNHIDRIKEHLLYAKPTLMTTVPRLLEKIYKKSMVALEEETFIKRYLGTCALKAATGFPSLLLRKFFDVLVYKKIRKKFGGNLRMIISGGAALPNDIERFFNNIGMPVYQGYGLTETSPVISVNYPGHNKPGTCGKVLPNVEVKTEKNKELLVKGPNVMQGYYKARKATKEIFKGEWLRTGDLAEIDSEGYVTLIGRKKESFKTSTGKYVVPTPIEHLVQKSKYVDQCLVIAEGKPFVSCLVFISEEHKDTENLELLIKQHIKKINNHLDQWEKIYQFIIIKKALSIEEGEITPSMKIRRHAVEEKYKNEIQDLYK
jgi:long-chain acyl-CoA synthetase